MGKKFSLVDCLPETALPVPDSGTAQTAPLADIRPNPLNFYSLDGIEDLAESIQLNGLLHPLTVIALEGGSYRLISGHRRYHALRWLHDQPGGEKWDRVPVTVVEDPRDPVREELMLIQANSTGRVLTGPEMAQQARRLKECLQILRDSGVELPGRLRGIVADQMGVSSAKLSRLEAVEKRLTEPALRQAWVDGEINESVAYSLSQMTKRDQSYAAQEISDRGISLSDLTAADVKAVREVVVNGESDWKEIEEFCTERGISLSPDGSSAWLEVLRMSDIPERFSGAAFSSRAQAVAELRRRYSHSGFYGGDIWYDGDGNGLFLKAPLRHYVSWAELYDMLALLALERPAAVPESGTLPDYRLMGEYPEEPTLALLIRELGDDLGGGIAGTLARWQDGAWRRTETLMADVEVNLKGYVYWLPLREVAL